MEDSRGIIQSDQWGCTKVNVVKMTYAWTIVNFGYCSEKYMVSPEFSVSPDSQIKWELWLFPNGKNVDLQEHVSLYLHPSKAFDRDLNVRYTFSIIDKDRERKNASKAHQPYTFKKGETTGHGFGEFVMRSLLLDEESHLLTDNKLTILVELSYADGVETLSGENKPDVVKIPQTLLVRDLARLLEQGTLTDVVLVAKDGELGAHKAILAARSTVFSKMFEHDTIEKQTNMVKIDDIELGVLKEMVRFLYTDYEICPVGMGTKLLMAAEKYDLQRLKAACEKELCSRLSIQNVVEMLIFASVHNADQLKSQAIKFTNEHAELVLATDKFKSMFDTHPDLVAEVALCRLLDVKKNTNTSERALFDREQKIVENSGTTDAKPTSP